MRRVRKAVATPYTAPDRRRPIDHFVCVPADPQMLSGMAANRPRFAKPLKNLFGRECNSSRRWRVRAQRRATSAGRNL